MLPSNILLKLKRCRLVFSLLLLTFLVGCTSFKIGEKTSDKDQAVSDEHVKTGSKENEGAEGAQLKSSQTQRKLIPDPMADLDLPLDVIKSYEQVKNLNQNNDFEQSINLLKQLQIKYPHLSGPSYLLARIHQEQKNLPLAIEFVNQAVTIQPNNYYALNLKGLLCRENGEFELAKQSYLKAIGIYFNHSNSHLNLAILADIYLYDLELALNHYEIYMDLTNQSDEKTAGWIVDLKRRIIRENEQ